MIRHRWIGGALAAAALVAAGCGGQPTASLDTAQARYDRGEYALAYEEARRVALSSRPEAQDAAYLAGLAAKQRGDRSAAERFLRVAGRGPDRGLAGEAMAALGVLYADQSRFDRAAQALQRAASYLHGEDRARAYFYAAVAQQKLGQWTQARSSLRSAAALSDDPSFSSRASRQAAFGAFAVQLGAFADAHAAQRLAFQHRAETRRAGLAPPRVVMARDEAGRLLHRVHVGRFSRFAQARFVAQRIGIPEAIVVPVE